MEINHESLREMLSLNRAARKSVMIKGGVGIGKSFSVAADAMEAAAKSGRRLVEWNKMGAGEKRRLAEDAAERSSAYVFADVRVSLMDPGDFRLPHVNGAPYTEWRPGLLFHVLSFPETMATLFLDELTHANPSMQAAAFQVAHDRAVGDVTFSDGVFIAAAGNRVEDRGGAFDMLLPLRARFSNYTLRAPTIDEWCGWAAREGVDTRIMGFLRFSPGSLYDKVEDAMRTRDQGFACCRTWTDASVLIGGVGISHKDSEAAKSRRLETLMTAAAGRVGEGHAQALKAFVKRAIDVDMDDLLDNPGMLSTMDLDTKWAMMSGLAEVNRSAPRKLEKILGVLEVAEDELGAACFRMILDYEKGRGRTQAFINRVLACERRSVFTKHSKWYEGD